MKVKYGPYSPSRLDVAACPLRFTRQYINKDVDDTSNPQSRRGNVVHETLEEITKAWLAEKDLSWKEVEDVLSKKVAEYQVVDPNDIKLCVGAARAYMDNPPVETLPNILGTEESLAMKWSDEKGDYVECSWDDPECIRRGKIDLLAIKDDVATIIDHKTQMHIEPADTFQMGYYAWLVSRFYPFVKEVRTILHFCHPDLDCYSKPVTWTREDIEMHDSEIKIRISGAEGITEPVAVPSYHCNYCPLQLECPVIEKLNKKRTKFGNVKKSPIVSANEAQELAGIKTVVEESMKTINNKLREFVGNVGPVVIPGKEISYKKSTDWQIKRGHEQEIFDMLKSVGIDPFTVFRPNQTSLKGLWRGVKPGFIKKMKEHMEETHKTSFGSRKL